VSEDRGAQTKSEAKRLRSSTNFCHHIFVHEYYSNKAPDVELATVPCLAWWLALPYLLIKLVRWDNCPRDTPGSSNLH